MSEQETPPREQTKEELLRRIRRAYQDLDNLLRPLSAETLAIPDTNGWAIKDHLAHLATWELGVVSLLRGESRFGTMQVQEAVDQHQDEDEINDLIYRRNAGLTAVQARELLDDAHNQMLDVLEGLDNEDLFKPYDAYLPEAEQVSDLTEGEEAGGSQGPVLGWVVGNSYGHYDEHINWIRQHPAYPRGGM